VRAERLLLRPHPPDCDHCALAALIFSGLARIGARHRELNAEIHDFPRGVLDLSPDLVFCAPPKFELE
jgi:hypothetical protein